APPWPPRTRAARTPAWPPPGSGGAARRGERRSPSASARILQKRTVVLYFSADAPLADPDRAPGRRGGLGGRRGADPPRASLVRPRHHRLSNEDEHRPGG